MASRIRANRALNSAHSMPVEPTAVMPSPVPGMRPGRTVFLDELPVLAHLTSSRSHPPAVQLIRTIRTNPEWAAKHRHNAGNPLGKGRHFTGASNPRLLAFGSDELDRDPHRGTSSRDAQAPPGPVTAPWRAVGRSRDGRGRR